MKKVLINIIKIFMFIILQYSIIMGYMVFAAIVGDSYYSCEILYWIISVLAFLLGEGAIFLICIAKQPEKGGIYYHNEKGVYHSTRRLFFNIMKLLMSIVLQCYMILAIPSFLPNGWGFKDIIIKVIMLLGVLLGEGSIYFLCAIKPLENKKKNKIFTIIYASVQIILFGVLLYGYFREML